jgi:histidinol phosphatase-like enzyme
MQRRRESPRRPLPLLPIPGTTRAPRALFVGRWSACLAAPSGGFRGEFRPELFSAGAEALLFRASQAGWTIYLIGNEDAVAEGRVSDHAWTRFEEALLGWLAGRGIRVARNYACLDHPEGRGAHRRDSVFLFPNTGALYHAAQEDGIQLGDSWIVSSDPLELAAGWRAGCRIARVGGGRAARHGPLEVEAEIAATDLSGVLRELLSAEASA